MILKIAVDLHIKTNQINYKHIYSVTLLTHWVDSAMKLIAHCHLSLLRFAKNKRQAALNSIQWRL